LFQWHFLRDRYSGGSVSAIVIIRWRVCVHRQASAGCINYTNAPLRCASVSRCDKFHLEPHSQLSHARCQPVSRRCCAMALASRPLHLPHPSLPRALPVPPPPTAPVPRRVLKSRGAGRPAPSFDCISNSVDLQTYIKMSSVVRSDRPWHVGEGKYRDRFQFRCICK